MGKRELVALLSLSSWCLMIVVWLFLGAPWVSLQFVIVLFPDHIHLLFLRCANNKGADQPAQFDQRLCYSLPEKYSSQSCYSQNSL